MKFVLRALGLAAVSASLIASLANAPSSTYINASPTDDAVATADDVSRAIEGSADSLVNQADIILNGVPGCC